MRSSTRPTSFCRICSGRLWALCWLASTAMAALAAEAELLSPAHQEWVAGEPVDSH